MEQWVFRVREDDVQVRSERDRINRTIADLIRSRDVLDEVIDRAGQRFVTAHAG